MHIHQRSFDDRMHGIGWWRLFILLSNSLLYSVENTTYVSVQCGWESGLMWVDVWLAVCVCLYVYECALLERWVYFLCYVSCIRLFLLIYVLYRLDSLFVLTKYVCVRMRMSVLCMRGGVCPVLRFLLEFCLTCLFILLHCPIWYTRISVSHLFQVYRLKYRYNTNTSKRNALVSRVL